MAVSKASQAAFKANVTRKHVANRKLLTEGKISAGTCAALNAHVTRQALRKGMKRD